MKKVRKVPAFRKAAMGTWKTARDPSVYSTVEIEIDEVLEMIPKYSEKYGEQITLNHLIGKAFAICMVERPEINGMIRGSRIWLRESVTLNYLVNSPGSKGEEVSGASLSAVSIPDAEKMSIQGIAKDMREKVKLAKDREDEDIQQNMTIIKWLPWWMVRYFLDLASWLIYGLNLRIPGIPDDPFGSITITNVGSLGVGRTFAPLVPYSRVPFLVTVCSLEKKPWVVDDEIKIRTILPVCVTFDHRFMDGAHAAQMNYRFKKCFKEPEKYLFTE